MTDPTSGGYSSPDEPTTRRLPLRTSSHAGGDEATSTGPWKSTTHSNDNPFSGSALGTLPENPSPVSPFGKPSPGPGDIDDAEPQRRARTSFPAALGLILSLVAACAAVTAWFAPLVVVVGGLAVLLSVISLFTAHAPHVSGRVLAVFAILIGLGAVALGLADHFGTFGWLDHSLLGDARKWINDRVPYLGG